jgi:hypothetical protein
MSQEEKLSIPAQVAINNIRLDRLEKDSEKWARKEDLTTLSDKLKNLVTKDEFNPVRMLVFGAAGPILLAAVAAFAKLALK